MEGKYGPRAFQGREQPFTFAFNLKKRTPRKSDLRRLCDFLHIFLTSNFQANLPDCTTCETKNVFLLKAFVLPVVDHQILALVEYKQAGIFCLSD